MAKVGGLPSTGRKMLPPIGMPSTGGPPLTGSTMRGPRSGGGDGVRAAGGATVAGSTEAAADAAPLDDNVEHASSPAASSTRESIRGRRRIAKCDAGGSLRARFIAWLSRTFRSDATRALREIPQHCVTARNNQDSIRQKRDAPPMEARVPLGDP